MWEKIKSKILLVKECISFVVVEVKWKDRSKYGQWDGTAKMNKPADLYGLKNLYLHQYTRVQPGLRLISYTGKLILKKYAACGANLTVVTGNHVPTVGIPQFFLGNFHINDKEKDIIIGESAWIGANTTLLSGAKIGRGAVIGACSLVNKEIPPYAVAVGMPAKVIATSFSFDQVIEHEKKVYPIEERLDEDYLQDLFETQFKGLKSIGTDIINPSDWRAAQKIERIILTINNIYIFFFIYQIIIV